MYPNFRRIREFIDSFKTNGFIDLKKSELLTV